MKIDFLINAFEDYIGEDVPGTINWQGGYEAAHDAAFESLTHMCRYTMIEVLEVEVKRPIRTKFTFEWLHNWTIRETSEVLGSLLKRELKRAVLRGQIPPPSRFRPRKPD